MRKYEDNLTRTYHFIESIRLRGLCVKKNSKNVIRVLYIPGGGETHENKLFTATSAGHPQILNPQHRDPGTGDIQKRADG